MLSLERPLRKMALGLAVAAALLGAGPAAEAQPIVIKMASLVPKGSSWHQILLEMGEKWKTVSGGKVTLIIYAGQTMGDDPVVISKMKIGSLQAALLASVGEIDRSVYALQVPMLYSSYDEVDYVLEKLTPRLNKALDAKGFIVLDWIDGGWIHFFTKTPALRPDDLKPLKLFAWAGDNDVIETYKRAGFNPVPLPSTEVSLALQNGMVTAIPASPQAAVVLQWYTHAKNMTDIKWALLLGATVITKKAWEKIPEDIRPKLLEAAKEAGRRFREETRKNGPRDVEAMKKNGLNVVHADKKVEAEWRKAAENAYPQVRGGIVPPDDFDEARKHLDEYRKQHPGPVR